MIEGFWRFIFFSVVKFVVVLDDNKEFYVLQHPLNGDLVIETWRTSLKKANQKYNFHSEFPHREALREWTPQSIGWAHFCVWLWLHSFIAIILPM